MTRPWSCNAVKLKEKIKRLHSHDVKEIAVKINREVEIGLNEHKKILFSHGHGEKLFLDKPRCDPKNS